MRMEIVDPEVPTGHFCTPITCCRICGSTELLLVIDLGSQQIGTHVLDEETSAASARTYPLELVRCAGSSGCGLLQLRHTLDSGALYERYGYRSGINRTMPANLAGIVAQARELVMLESNDVVLDIGCNDGTLLDCYNDAQVIRVGFDPSPNVAATAAAKGHQVAVDYFGAARYRSMFPSRQAKIVTSIAMFYDLPDPMQFTADIAAVLDADGVWVIELSYLPLMLKNHSYDTICHEHLEYYALRQIDWLLGKNGLKLQRVALNDVNGGSFRLFVVHQTREMQADDAEVEAVRQFERSFQLESEQVYANFRTQVERSRNELRNVIAHARSAGETIYVYGASTKGNTILQFCGIDNSMVPRAADRNPEKWGYRTPGSRIEIVSEEQARKEQPDYFLVLPWHFLEEFAARERDYLNGGGRFIVPLPEVRVLTASDL